MVKKKPLKGPISSAFLSIISDSPLLNNSAQSQLSIKLAHIQIRIRNIHPLNLLLDLSPTRSLLRNYYFLSLSSLFLISFLFFYLTNLLILGHLPLIDSFNLSGRLSLEKVPRLFLYNLSILHKANSIARRLDDCEYEVVNLKGRTLIVADVS